MNLYGFVERALREADAHEKSREFAEQDAELYT